MNRNNIVDKLIFFFLALVGICGVIRYRSDDKLVTVLSSSVIGVAIGTLATLARTEAGLQNTQIKDSTVTQNTSVEPIIEIKK